MTGKRPRLWAQGCPSPARGLWARGSSLPSPARAPALRVLALLALALALRAASAQPASWLADVARLDKLWTASDAAVGAELLPIVGNGFLAMQVADDSLYVSGLFNGKTVGNGFGPCHRAALPADVGALAGVPAPGEPADAALDVRRAVYYRRSFLDPAPPGTPCSALANSSCSTAQTRVYVEQRFFAHRALPSAFVMEVELLETDGSIVNARAGDAGPIAYLRLMPTPAYNASDVNLTHYPSPPDLPSVVVRSGWTQLQETPATPLQGLTIVSTNMTCAATPSGLWPFSAFGETQTFLTVVRTTIETPVGGVTAAAQADFRAAAAMAANGTALLDSHVDAWAAVWTSGLEIEGRPDVARAVNSSLYSLYSSARPDRPFGLSPGGLTAGYYGHVFWDQDTWMFPPINALAPQLAESLLDYRFNRIAAAEARAQGYRPPYSGTMFPWQSALSGFETTPTFASYGPDREIHVNGDIASAAIAYFRGTGDEAWLAAKGYPLLSGIANFWLSKIALSGNPPPALLPNASDLLHIRSVVGPDEYHDHVDDSAYTNAVAALSLRYAAQAAALLGRDPGFAAQWRDFASRIYLPFNASGPGIPEGGLHPEYDQYELGVTVKQADTILLAFPLGFEHATMTPAAVANDLAYYGNHTDTKNGPAMTWAMYHVGFVGLGAAFAEKASSMLNQSFQLNAWPPFSTWMESPGGRGTPNFLTGAGGFLQAALSGFPGLRLTDTALALQSPQLAPGATRVVLRGLAYLGSRFDVVIEAAQLSVTLRAAEGGAARAFALVDAAGARHALTSGAPVVLTPQSVRIVAAA